MDAFFITKLAKVMGVQRVNIQFVIVSPCVCVQYNGG